MADDAAKDAPKKPSKVTAFELDPATVGDNDAHPYTFGGFPGLWQVGRPTLPAALGLTLERMRELVDQFKLPLVEVKVPESRAYDTFEVPAQMIESGPQVQEPVQPQPELLEVNGELIPGPIPSAAHPPLQPFAAAAMARDTAALRGGDVEDVLDEMGVDDETTRDQALHDSTAQTVGG